MADRTVEQKFNVSDLNSEQLNAIKDLFQSKNWSLKVETKTADKTVEQLEKPYYIPPDNEKDKCPFCFCRPCVTDESNRQLWWGNSNGVSHRANAASRKGCYRNFWAMMSHRGVWQIEEYTDKKKSQLRLNKGNIVTVRREIMPECVLKAVRNWYPKTDDEVYMGHTWA